MSDPVRLSVEEFQSLIEDAYVGIHAHEREDSPIECVGFVLQSGAVYRLKNRLNSPHRFEVDPEEVKKAFAWALRNDTSVVALYHSHPVTRSRMSTMDLDMVQRYEMFNMPFLIYGTDGLSAWIVAEHETDPELVFHLERFDV